MDSEFDSKRVNLRRSEEERRPLIQRLGRIEGQVRGLRQMIEEDRYCLDEVQQANAIIAAVREVMLMVVSSHLAAGFELATDAPERDAILQEMMGVLRAGLRQ